MRKSHKILLIIVLIIIVILIWAIWTLQLPRYHRLKKRKTLFELDRTFKERQQFCKRACQERIVVSMSTIPDRIEFLGPTLASWMDQTVLPDEIAINIPHVSRKGLPYHIPKWLESLKSVTIHRVEKDEGPGTKLLPTLRRERRNKDTRIIVGDDDNIYNTKIIETLLKTHDRWRKRGHLVAVTNYGVSLTCKGQLPSIPERTRVAFIGEKEVDLLQGFSGFLVTPRLFKSKEVYDIHRNGPSEAISVDDVWFSGWLRKDKRKIISTSIPVFHAPIVASGKIRQTTALAHGENKNFVTDLKVIKWFIDTHHVLPVACSR